MGKEAIDRDIMKEFERDSFRAKRAIVVAIILCVILIGILAVTYFLQGTFYSREHNEPLEAHSEFADSFAIATYNTPVELKIDRTFAVDIYLIEESLYNDAEGDRVKLRQWAIKYELDSNEFEFEGDLDTGEYVIFFTSCGFDDIVNIKLTRYVIQPCMLWILIVIALLVLLLFLRIGLKFRRAGIIKRDRNEYMARATARPPPSQASWGGRPPPGEVPIYEAAYKPPSSPQYSKADMDYFGSVDDTGGREDSGRLEFTPPPSSARERTPPPPKGEPAMRHRPPRPAFRKRDKYGFKKREKSKEKEKPKEKKERFKKDTYQSKRVRERHAREKEKKHQEKKKEKKKEKKGGYLDFDDFD
jgi:hypothetical protein